MVISIVIVSSIGVGIFLGFLIAMQLDTNFKKDIIRNVIDVCENRCKLPATHVIGHLFLCIECKEKYRRYIQTQLKWGEKAL